MLVFLPPVAQALIGTALFGAGVAAHDVILGAFGCAGTAVGGYRWLRRRRDGGAAR
jgi:hypothetical protein